MKHFFSMVSEKKFLLDLFLISEIKISLPRHLKFFFFVRRSGDVFAAAPLLITWPVNVRR